DTSGSMEGAAIDDARQACLTLVSSMKDGDGLAIVTFGSEPKVVLPATRLDAEARGRAKLEIGRIQASGTTDLAGGLSTGLAQLGELTRLTGASTDGIKRVVLLGDGVPNDANAMGSLAAQAKALGAPI